MQGDYPAARAWYEEGLTVCLKMGSQVPIASSLEGLAGVLAAHSAMGLSTTAFLPCLEGLAGVVAAQGQPTWATRLLGAAEALREAFGIPLAPVERADYERAVTAASIHLGEQSFTAAWLWAGRCRLSRCSPHRNQGSYPPMYLRSPARLRSFLSLNLLLASHHARWACCDCLHRA